MRTWSIPIGKIAGIDIRIHFTFMALLVFIIFADPAGPAGSGRALALVAIIFGSVVLHELGHGLVAVHAGLPVRSITLLPIGGVTLMDTGQSGHPPPAVEIRVAAAGPLVNLGIAGVGAFVVLAVYPAAEVWLWQPPFVQASNLPRALVWTNLFMALFNLLPAYPMDGGRILRAFLARDAGYLAATRRAVTIGQGFAMFFMFLGLWHPWMLLIGFFLFFAAQLEERSIMFQSVLENVRLEEVMLTDFSTLSPADTLEDALSKAVHTLQDDFPVIRGADMVGVVSKQRILAALREDGNAYVQSVMNKAFEIAQRGETLASALKKFTAKELTLLPVVEAGRLVGIVTLQNLMHSMALLSESRKIQRVDDDEED
ncbi:MAG: site-2 protease family protein [Candidatus Koribacter versatilis]|uniref:Zinc metalloprotease n=1 Tax=Candidatus Korobacter versatilis TaxID=658062 RepID=A0A932ENZ0_9BACT|nr:site-2 protease family protein [Candidatus Koribacter versatilis]